MLVNALGIEVLDTEEKKSNKKKDEEEVVIFTDISKTSPYYPYAMAAYNAGLASGGTFSGSMPLTREAMIQLNVKAVGLERLGTGATQTSYIDDDKIAVWAKPAVYAAAQLGIAPDSNDYFLPKKQVTYSEAAAMMNQYLDYLRYELQKDYNDKMMP